MVQTRSSRKRTRAEPPATRATGKRARNETNEVDEEVDEEEASVADGSCPDSSDEADWVLERHVAAAKSILLAALEARGVGDERHGEFWESLAGTAWRNDPEICAAFLKLGMEARKLQGLTILEDPAAVVRLLASTKNQAQARDLWGLLGEGLRIHPGVALAALNRGGIPAAAFPETFLDDRAVFCDAIRKNRLRWSALPKPHKKDAGLAVAAVHHSRPAWKVREAQKVLATVDDPEKVWREGFCKLVNYFRLPQGAAANAVSFWDGLPVSIRRDRRIMTSMISNNCGLAKYLDDELARDEGFVRKLLEESPLALGFLPRSTFATLGADLLLHRDRMARYMRASHEVGPVERLVRASRPTHYRKIESLRSTVPPARWHDHGFVRDWLAATGTWCDDIPPPFRDDRELVRVWVESESWFPFSFHTVSERLRSDQAFLFELLQMAQKHPETKRVSLLYSVPSSTKNDFGFLLALCANHCSLYQKLHRRDEEFRNRVRDDVKVYQRFAGGILCGARPESGSPLVRLNQTDVQRMIASCLGVPSGEDLRNLLRAASNLGIRGFAPDTETASSDSNAATTNSVSD